MADSDFPKPPDVPAYVPVAAVWPADGVPVLGTNPPPASAYALTDPNPITQPGWTYTSAPEEETSTASAFKAPVPVGHGTEAKFRTHINFSHVLRDDPVRNYGKPGTSHWHTFLGNTSVNGWSTYRSLRNHPSSNSAGGPLNGSAYWIPSWLVTLEGLLYAKIPDFATVYYSADMPEAELHEFVRLAAGMRYVAGWNMEDHHLTAVKAEMEATAPGAFTDPYDGFGGWKMVHYQTQETLPTYDQNGQPRGETSGGTFYPYRSIPNIVHANGADPWLGAANSNYRLIGDINAPNWWDGVNLWSPGGYKHLRYAARHMGTGRQGVGPVGWYRIPQLLITFAFSHGGWEDYRRWTLSSDNHLAHHDPGHAPMLPGSTFHADWFGAWDDATMLKWMRNGQGVDGFTPHEMNDSRISATEVLISQDTGPGSNRTPQVNVGNRFATAPGSMILLPPSGSGKGPFVTRSKAVGLVTAAGAPLGLDSNRVEAIGDSITAHAYGYAGRFDEAHPELTFERNATGGWSTSNVLANLAATIAKKPKYVSIFLGGNDLTNYYNGTNTEAANAFVAALTEICNQLKAALTGVKVAVATVLPNTVTADHETRRSIANPLIRAGEGAWHDKLVDFAADPIVGPLAAASDPLLYPDGLHPSADGQRNGSNGHAYLAYIYDQAMSQMMGITPVRTYPAVYLPAAPTWDAAKKPSGITLSADLLTATANNLGTTRATQLASAALVSNRATLLECTVSALAGGNESNIAFGVCPPSTAANTRPGMVGPGLAFNTGTWGWEVLYNGTYIHGTYAGGGASVGGKLGIAVSSSGVCDFLVGGQTVYSGVPLPAGSTVPFVTLDQSNGVVANFTGM